jgi:predicted HTH transcriptional regulator
VDTESELDRLIKNIDNFKRELSLNPRSANSILEKVVDLLEQLNLLSDADKILSLVRKGESKTVEFKETLSLDVKKKTKEKYIEKPVLKTIVGFLNTDGGILLVGISNDGVIHGLQDEISRFHKNLDKFLLHFKNLIKDQIGEEFYPDINYRIVDVSDKNVLFIECNASSKPCFLDGKEFYVRTNPATDLLEGPKLIEYISRRFHA